MESYYTGVILSFIIIIIYGTISLLAAIFSFSLNTYLKIEEKLNFYITLAPPVSNPIEQIKIGWINDWLVNHHKIAGPLLIILSLIDLKLWLDIINMLNVLRL